MEDIARIVVESEDGAVGIPAVAHIPLLHLAAGRVDAELVELRAGLGQQALDGRREEKPVGVRRVNLSQRLKLLDVPLPGHLVERQPQHVPSPEKRLGDIGGVDQILPCLAPAEIVGRVGIDRILIGRQGPLAQLAPLHALGRLVVGQCEPGSDAGHEPAESLHVDHAAVAVVERGREFCLHIFLQLAPGHVFQHGLGYLVGQRAPILAVGGLLLCFPGCVQGQEQHHCSHHDIKSLHLIVYLILFWVFVDFTVRTMRYISFPHICRSSGSSRSLMFSTAASIWRASKSMRWLPIVTADSEH